MVYSEAINVAEELARSSSQEAPDAELHRAISEGQNAEANDQADAILPPISTDTMRPIRDSFLANQVMGIDLGEISAAVAESPLGDSDETDIKVPSQAKEEVLEIPAPDAAEPGIPMDIEEVEEGEDEEREAAPEPSSHIDEPEPLAPTKSEAEATPAEPEEPEVHSAQPQPEHVEEQLEVEVPVSVEPSTEPEPIVTLEEKAAEPDTSPATQESDLGEKVDEIADPVLSETKTEELPEAPAHASMESEETTAEEESPKDIPADTAEEDEPATTTA